MTTSYTISKCQISGSRKLSKILNLGYLPPVNFLKKIGSKSVENIFYPAELLYCKVSKLFQINCIVDKSILFPKSYPYTSSTTKILRDNFKNLFASCKKKIKFNKRDLIVDIGSNDGNLLSNFLGESRVLGVTPEDIGKIAIKRGIPTILDYFNKKTVGKILNRYGKAKIVTATNVFAHIDEPNQLCKNISRILTKDGVFVSENHYICSLIETLQYDTIYHEHLRYYSLHSLQYLFKKNNFFIFNVEKINTHGGSIRVYSTQNKDYKINNNFYKILNEEKKILSLNNINSFKKKVLFSKFELLKIISDIKKKNKKIFAVGAPSRASTLIHYVGINEDMVDCVLEVNGSHKLGHYLPGTLIPIYDEKILKKIQPDYILILSWHIADELILNLKNKGYKGKFIIPLPSPSIK